MHRSRPPFAWPAPDCFLSGKWPWVCSPPPRATHRDKIQSGTGKAKGAMDRIAHKDGTDPGGDIGTPPASPPPTS